MALVFYEKLTGLIRRTVLDKNLTDAQLELRHLPQGDEGFLHLDVTLETWNLQAVQHHVDQATGLSRDG